VLVRRLREARYIFSELESLEGSVVSQRESRLRSVGTLLLCALFCFISPFSRNARAQETPAPQAPPDKNQAEMSSHEAPATFKAKVNLVLVPVVVRDSQGRGIGNLKQEDFQVFDKGKPQLITKFSVEKSGGKATLEKSTGGSLPQAAPGQETTLTMPDRYVAYLFDDVHLKFEDLARVRDAAARHLAGLASVDRAAIFTTSGQTMLDFTDDRAKLNDSLLRLRPRPITGSGVRQCPDVSYYMADLIVNKNDTQAMQAAVAEVQVCMPNTPRADQMVRMAAQQQLSSGDHETRVSLSVVKDAVRRISAMPGKRNLVLVSPGFIAPFDLVHEKTEIIDRANRSSVIISALDARGLYVLIPGGDASQPSGFSLDAERMKSEFRRQEAFVQSDILAELSEGTGGTFVHDNNDLDEGFRRVDSRPEYLYMLAFSPQNLKLDGTFHKLKVTLKEPNKVTLQARRGYYAPKRLDDPAETAKQEIQDALFSREAMHDIPLELHTQFFKASEDSAKVTVLIRLDVKRIHFRKVDGRNRNDLTIVSGLFDRNGNYVTAIEKKLEMRLKDETLEKRVGSGITVRTSFDVKPGSYLVRLVVRDAEGQLMSAENGAVEIP
jgi:VWFA-related protein